MADIAQNCSYCGSRLKKWRVPDDASWDDEFFFICFNDECSYYKDGWKWMKEQYNQVASYRFMINPSTGSSSMIPVWSDTATREMIVEETEGDDG